MSDAAVLVRRLFGTPGHLAPDGSDLLGRAAAAHRDLLTRACAGADPALCSALAPIRAYLGGPAPAAEKRRLLCHPLLVEGLHALAPLSPELRRWHECVTAPPADAPAEPAAPAAAAALGHVALAARLRTDPGWHGECALCTDGLGRVGFPFSDWVLELHD